MVDQTLHKLRVGYNIYVIMYAINIFTILFSYMLYNYVFCIEHLHFRTAMHVNHIISIMFHK